MSFESVFGALFGALLLHERMTPRELLGCALIFAALVLSQVVPEKASRLSPEKKECQQS